jgi:hypothetical protein
MTSTEDVLRIRHGLLLSYNPENRAWLLSSYNPENQAWLLSSYNPENQAWFIVIKELDMPRQEAKQCCH